jgi:hypothetical protein
MVGEAPVRQKMPYARALVYLIDRRAGVGLTVIVARDAASVDLATPAFFPLRADLPFPTSPLLRCYA